ncbi:uncharacterized protein LOC132063206 [Lycium ferocissimum]|uniref:uncharacterized protein LOC132063206 n=1 Tax=Lycium ferocissimum TaxID=112874 RepID=UPI00281554CF|nr:uncharacterized protein LOC132063206 [Lycium ferocissimum]
MKRSIEGINGINFVDEEESKVKLKQKNMLNELLELQKDFVSKKRKLQAAKQRRDNILGEIIFLKQRHRYLLKMQSSNVDTERNISHMKNFDAESEVSEEEKSNNGCDAGVETARPAFTSKFNLGCEVGNEEVATSRDVLKLECMPKKYLIDDNNRVGKKKLDWHAQVTLKV